MSESLWHLRDDDETFGPETEARLIEWAQMGKIHPGQEISQDLVTWQRVEEVPFLDMRFSIDPGDGNPRGPFNRVAAEALIASGKLPPEARLVETRAPFSAAEPAISSASADEAEAIPAAAADAVSANEESAPGNAPSAASAPVIERIIEKTVTVVDDARIKELEGLLEEERRHTGDLQQRLDAASKAAGDQRMREAMLEAEAANARAEFAALNDRMERSLKDAVDRELKLNEQIRVLEDELRRLPQAASEVADIQAAMYSVMTKEAEELRVMLESEKAEAEAFHRRHQERFERLQERRRELLRRSGANIEEMTRRALVDRPEDPRTAQLRKELSETRHSAEQQRVEATRRIRELEMQLAEKSATERRTLDGLKDITELRQENQQLRERLQLREQELLAARQQEETMRQNQAARQQALMTRLAALETPSIASADSLETNQSRAMRGSKLPRWMRLGR